MLKIYHYPLCPFSRKLRIILKEKKINFELIIEKYWERRYEFVCINPAAETPVIIDQNNDCIAGNYAIYEYLEELNPEPPLFLPLIKQKAEIRRLVDWFDHKFFQEVTKYILSEKIIRIFDKGSAPNSSAIRAGKKNVLYHIDYIEHLLSHEEAYLCGERITIADFAAAAQLSVLDFVGDIDWDHSAKVKEWYALIKSRPSFKSILLDEIPGIYPPIYYTNPDF